MPQAPPSKKRRLPTWARVTTLTVIGLGLALWVMKGSEAFQDCVCEKKHGERYQAAKKSRDVFFVVVAARLYGGCAGHFANENSGALTALFTVALVIVGGLQVRVYHRQAGLMDRQSGIADRQAAIMEGQATTAANQTNIMSGQLVAAQSAAVAAEEQVRLARSHIHVDLRAYVGHEPNGAKFDLEAVPPAIAAGRVDLVTDSGPLKYYDVNFGKTPAKDIVMYVRVVDGAEPPETLDWTFSAAERQDVIRYAPTGQNIGRQITTPSGRRYTRENEFFLYGCVEYADVFDNRWRHRFGFSHSWVRRLAHGEEWVAHENDEQRWDKATGNWIAA